ncbi:MAG: protein BatD [Bdellovibrio sp.]|nr:protein BatD [Bdellovibrio sp.]
MKNYFLYSIFLFLPFYGLAADSVKFSVEAERPEISLDESLSIKFSVRAEGNPSVTEPSYDASDFELLSEFPSTSIESSWINGRASMQSIQEVTKILKPKKTGVLEIKNISIKVAGKTYHADDLKIRVDVSGRVSPPAQSYGGQGLEPRDLGKGSGHSRAFFLKAEVNKQKIYKGEQLIINYYLYRQVKMYDISVRKYPELNGFLKEELEMPVQGTSLDSEQVVVSGVSYYRSLLARYAVYPLKEGRLQVDPLMLQFKYIRERGGSSFGDTDDEDSFFGFKGFNRLLPLVGTSQSEIVSIDAVSIPQYGKSMSFSGGVGDFSLVTAVDKYEVHANEAVTLTLKIEGKGNASSIEEPKIQWPSSIEIFDSKGHSKSSLNGIGEKIFEFVLVPRAPGKVQLPQIEFSFFDPQQNKYVTRVSNTIEINVLDPLPGSALQAAKPHVLEQGIEMPGLKPLDQLFSKTDEWKPDWKVPQYISFILIFLLASMVSFDTVRAVTRKYNKEYFARLKLKKSKTWEQLEDKAKKAARGVSSWNDVVKDYEFLSGALYDAIDQIYPIGARALSRVDLKMVLVDEKNVSDVLWKRIELLLEYAEMVRFATSAGVIKEEDACSKLRPWVKEGKKIQSELFKSKKSM